MCPCFLDLEFSKNTYYIRASLASNFEKFTGDNMIISLIICPSTSYLSLLTTSNNENKMITVQKNPVSSQNPNQVRSYTCPTMKEKSGRNICFKNRVITLI